MSTQVTEAGARHSAADNKLIQQMHENAVALGADCKMGESLREADAILFGDSHDQRRQDVQRAVTAKFKDTTDPYGYSYGPYPYIRDMFDDVAIVAMGSDLFAIPYSMDDSGAITLGDPTEVECAYVPVTADETDELEALRAKPGAKIRERDIPQSARDKMDAADFAGKDKSFPIQKPADVAAAAKSIGRAGADNYDSETLKKNIIRIAKRKGAAFVAQLPKAWTDDKQEGAAPVIAAGAIALRESATVDITGMTPIREAAAAATKTIKLIQPGWGSSGYYSSEVLKRDGPKAFPANTQMFWNHATEAQEAERPEGDLSDLAAVTVSPAKWQDNGPAGAGLYAEAKVFSDYAEQVAEKGPYIGVSIRALGTAKQGEAEGRKGPVIESLEIGKSVDFVTRAGAGGQVLTESARTQQHSTITAAATSRNPNSGVQSMDDNKEVQALREAAANATAKADQLEQKYARLQGRALVSEARGFASNKLQGVELPDVTKNLIIERECKNPPATEDGTLDSAKFATQLEEAVKTEAAYLAQVTAAGAVKNLGAQAAQPTVAIDETKLDEILVKGFAGLGLKESAAKIAAKGRA